MPSGDERFDRQPTSCDRRRAYRPRARRVSAYRPALFTFNLPIVERTPVDRVGGPLLTAALENDRDMAVRYARDVGLLKRYKIKLDSGDDWRLTNTASELLDLAGDHLLRLECANPVVVRLHHVLANALAVSRSRVAALERSGAIRQVTPGNGRSLRVWSSCDVVVSGGPASRDVPAVSNA